MTILSDMHDVEVRERLAGSVALFTSLGDPTRLAILQILAGGEHRIVDLTRRLGLAQSTVSAHCACLRDCGLVTSRPSGRATVYTVAALQDLEALLAAAERVLEATGHAVRLCSTYGDGDGDLA